MWRYLSILFFIIISNAYANLPANDLIFRNVPHGKDYDVSLGTGFFIDNLTILTSAHVVNNCLDITVRDDNFISQATLLNTDEAMDLALLRISKSISNEILSLKLNNSSLQVNDLAYIWSYSTFPTFKQIQIVKTDHSSLYFSGDFVAGDSGSPIFDHNMDLIGILIAKIEIFDAEQGLISVTNQAISINNIIRFIKNSKIQFNNQQIQKRNSIKGKLKKNLVKIHCIKHE